MGLRLIALVLLASAWSFGIITDDVVHNQRMSAIDLQLAAYLHARATPFLNIVMIFISYFGSLAVTGGIAFAIGIILWRRRLYDHFLALSFAVPGGMLINVVVKYLVYRSRPFFEDPIVTLSSYSFPSGHAMASTVLYGLLAAFAIERCTDWWQRVIVGFIAFSLIGLVCFSRIYLGVHYLTDVLAGIAEGIAWLMLCLAASYMLKHGHDTSQNLSNL
jgi:membrane-associated phospholipid phosphatase